MNWERYNDLIALRDSGRINEAIAELAILGDVETDRATKAVVLTEVASGMASLGRLSDARRKLNEACALLGPEHEFYPRALFEVARLDMREENWKGALKKLDDISEKYSVVLQTEDHKDLFEEVQRRRGIALTKLKRFREARSLLKSVSLAEYDRVATLCYLGVCDFELKEYDSAMQTFEELLSLDPSSIFRAYANYYRGTVLFQRGQLARAKSEFEECLACPDRGEIPEDSLLGWLVDASRGLNLDDEVARYLELQKKGTKGSV